VRCTLPEARARKPRLLRPEALPLAEPAAPADLVATERRNVGKHPQLTFGDHARRVMTLAVS
jgi:hypothetical protein